MIVDDSFFRLIAGMIVHDSFSVSGYAKDGLNLTLFTRECNETSIAGSQKALTHSLTHSLDFVNYFIYGNYNVPYYNAADQCIRLSPW